MSSRSPHRRADRRDAAVRLLGGALLVCALTLVVLGPDVMSRWELTAWQLFVTISGAAYGMLLAFYSRHRQVALERAYSAHLEELSQRLRNMAYRDAVTGLYNHRYFREQLAHEVERAIRYAQPLSLVMMDMNNFKELNDRFGHFTGDRFLGLVGEIIERQVRASDIGARYGGDEFAIILPNTPAEEAHLTAEKLVASVVEAASTSSTGEPVQIGLSFGVAACPVDARTANELIERADARLYEAKARDKASRARRVA